MFLRQRWYCAALGNELGRQPLGRIFLNEPVVLYRKQDGTPIAMEDRCCHRRALLSKGRIEGDRIRCGYHGFVFEPSGVCCLIPGQDHIPPNARVRTYPLVEKHGWVWIWMGNPVLAKAEEIPEFEWYVKPGWTFYEGVLKVNAHYQLMVDNLLDLSHVSVLHPGTFGSPNDIAAELRWEREKDVLRGSRHSPNNPPSTRFKQEGIDFNTDKVQVMTYTVPSSISIEVIHTEAGKKPGDPTSRLELRLMVLNSMTPETEKTFHYFWASGRNYRLDDVELTKNLRRMMETTLGEDKEVVEGQQLVIELDPTAPQVYVAADAGATHARRMIERLLEEERQAAAAA